MITCVNLQTPPYAPVLSAKSVPQLSDVAIRAARPPAAGTITLWDESLNGFGVRISKGGAKTFLVLIGSGRQPAQAVNEPSSSPRYSGRAR